jgi:hypothetical protein
MENKEILDRIYDTLAGNVGMSEHHVKFDPDYIRVGDNVYFEIGDKAYTLTLEETTSESVIDHIYEELYEMDGFGLADYLNDWAADIKIPDDMVVTDVTFEFKASQNGEKVWLQVKDEGYPIEPIDIFDRWDLWRQEVSHYFNSYTNEMEFTNEETFKEVFVWKIACVLDIVYDQWVTFEAPEQSDKILFM